MDLTEKEVAFGKKLAHVDKEVRDQAVGKLSVFLSQDTELEYMEMLRQWKALFYCFWLSDKPLVQQELAWNLGNMILACKGVNRGRFLQAFWETICREWSALDKHRIDKYLLLLRRVVFFSLKSLEQSFVGRGACWRVCSDLRHVPAASDESADPAQRAHAGGECVY
ncbi:hypothetical protein DL89DRAFT_3550 [Linderina pennispora]|uniref:Nop52-domain-containing protein n=1 Tax=Linderina pennispora TaxID=61395 RepID=A0A1Y1WJK4_9FUNG|nr:uncharacterized protein DL89DRAFT_3550 [Linderina pennispora]ORX73761.1 hypothetical protein DL89DRAFT_3550 [Linderina pennispora]